MKATPPTKFKTFQEYSSLLPANKKRMLKELRKTIKEAAPLAEELISYNMPAFRFHGMLVYYAAFNEHIGFYPTSNVIKVFHKELALYEGSKGAIRFPLNEPLPLKLIKDMVLYRVKENLDKEQLKKAKPLKKK